MYLSYTYFILILSYYLFNSHRLSVSTNKCFHILELYWIYLIVNLPTRHMWFYVYSIKNKNVASNCLVLVCRSRSSR